jgi:hypothetical protein
MLWLGIGLCSGVSFSQERATPDPAPAETQQPPGDPHAVPEGTRAEEAVPPLPEGVAQALNKAKQALKDGDPKISSRAAIIAELWREVGRQAAAAPDQEAFWESIPSLPEVLEKLEVKEEDKPLIQGLLMTEAAADDPDALLEMIDALKPETPTLATRIAAAVIELRLALPENKPWIDLLLKMHSNAITKEKALYLLTRRRLLAAMGPEAVPLLAESLAKEKYSLIEDMMPKVPALLGEFKTPEGIEVDKAILEGMKKLYGPDGAVKSNAEEAWKKADEAAAVRAIEFDSNLTSVFKDDGTLDLNGEVTVTQWQGPSIKVSKEEWLRSLEQEFGLDALLQWGTVHGGAAGGRTILAALRSRDPKSERPPEFRLTLPSSEPQPVGGNLSVKPNDQIQLSSKNPPPEQAAAELRALLPVDTPDVWQRVRPRYVEAAPTQKYNRLTAAGGKPATVEITPGAPSEQAAAAEVIPAPVRENGTTPPQPRAQPTAPRTTIPNFADRLTTVATHLNADGAMPAAHPEFVDIQTFFGADAEVAPTPVKTDVTLDGKKQVLVIKPSQPQNMKLITTLADVKATLDSGAHKAVNRSRTFIIFGYDDKEEVLYLRDWPDVSQPPRILQVKYADFETALKGPTPRAPQ